MLTLVVGMAVMVRGEMLEKEEKEEKEGLTHQCHNLLGADGRDGDGAALVFCRFSSSHFDLSGGCHLNQPGLIITIFCYSIKSILLQNYFLLQHKIHFVTELFFATA